VLAFAFASCSGTDSTDSSRTTQARAGTAESTTTEATPTPRSVEDTERLTPATSISATGDDRAVCVQALDAVRPEGSDGVVTVVEAAAFGVVRWLVCAGDRSIGTGVVSARTQDGVHWSVTSLCFDAPYHAGDTLDAHIEDERRAWVTADMPNPGSHRHAWTADRGDTWECSGELNFR
jgi:hypothetical protein